MPSQLKSADIAIVGGGIIGLATAYEFALRHPQRTVLLLEKEQQLATHQTGRNSGVIHSGIYYLPGSQRAVNCRAGKAMLEKFCGHYGIPHERCGKVIVAVSDDELPQLQKIYERGIANGVKCELIERARLQELEPHSAGVRAIHVPEAGIVDYPAVCAKLAELAQRVNTRIVLGAKVERILNAAGEVRLETTAGEFVAKWLVTCAGLHADRVAEMGGNTPREKIVPFRGEYYALQPAAQRLCKNLIYPVPDPRFPFLGAHFTRMIKGGVECGPNAVLAWAREGYTGRDINWGDLRETLGYVGFRRLAWKYWRMGLGELWRSWSKKAFVKELQRLIPELTLDDVTPAPAGVRAQAVSPQGEVIDDFVIEESPRAVHVINAPSPAATASLAIGKNIAERIVKKWW